MNIAILGAPRTGKTALAVALRQRLKTLGLHDVRVSDAPPDMPLHHPIILLCGLDLPGPVDHSQVDAAVRTALALSGQPFQVVYGQGEERLRNALFAISRQWPEHAQLLRSEAPVRWQGECERCSDADCEHRLFSRLLTP